MLVSADVVKNPLKFEFEKGEKNGSEWKLGLSIEKQTSI
jgi:hypothetical protein